MKLAPSRIDLGSGERNDILKIVQEGHIKSCSWPLLGAVANRKAIQQGRTACHFNDKGFHIWSGRACALAKWLHLPDGGNSLTSDTGSGMGKYQLYWGTQGD